MLTKKPATYGTFLIILLSSILIRNVSSFTPGGPPMMTTKWSRIIPSMSSPLKQERTALQSTAPRNDLVESNSSNSWIDLPKSFIERRPEYRDVFSEIDSLDTFEMTIGRIAMVASLVLLGNELMTGCSLPEQISYMSSSIVM